MGWPSIWGQVVGQHVMVAVSGWKTEEESHTPLVA